MIMITEKHKVKKIVEEINTNGFFHYSNLISFDECSSLLKKIESMKGTINIPYSDIPWGFGNLLYDKNFMCISENQIIKNVSKHYLSKEFVYNHLMVNNKSKWIGPGVEWHQEIFNVNTYAPGGNKNDDSWKNFLQIYIALDEHTLENGCLKVVPKSHNLGVLPHEDMVNELLNHKRRIPYNVMCKVMETHVLENVYMKPGDVLFFNHRFIHGSASNTSGKPRRSIVMQSRLPFLRDEKIYNNEIKYRTDFVNKVLKNKLEKINGKNTYRDFKKDKK